MHIKNNLIDKLIWSTFDDKKFAKKLLNLSVEDRIGIVGIISKLFLIKDKDDSENSIDEKTAELAHAAIYIYTSLGNSIKKLDRKLVCLLEAHLSSEEKEKKAELTNLVCSLKEKKNA